MQEPNRTTAPAPQRAVSCTVPLTPARMENRGMLWIIGAFLVCPCHLPLTLALAGVLLAGTTAGALLRSHPFAAGVLITLAWVAGTWRGFYLLRAARRFAAARTAACRQV